jgi:hypothetical protein
MVNSISGSISRRQALERLVLGGALTIFPSLALSQQPNQYPAQPSQRVEQTSIPQQQPAFQADQYQSLKHPKKAEKQAGQNPYRIVARRGIMRARRRVLNAELYVEGRVWDNLPRGLSEQQFYNSLNNAYMLSVSEIKLADQRVKLDSSRFEEHIIKGAAELARTYPQFTPSDQAIFQNMLRRNIYRQDKRSGMLQNIIFPTHSKICLQFGPAPSVDMWINIAQDPENQISYSRMGPFPITNPAEIATMNKFFRLSLLIEDPQTPGYDGRTIRCPLDNIYRNAYLRRP